MAGKNELGEKRSRGALLSERVVLDWVNAINPKGNSWFSGINHEGWGSQFNVIWLIVAGGSHVYLRRAVRWGRGFMGVAWASKKPPVMKEHRKCTTSDRAGGPGPRICYIKNYSESVYQTACKKKKSKVSERGKGPGAER